LATTTVEQYDELLLEIETAQAIDTSAVDVIRKTVGTPIVDTPDLHMIDSLDEEAINEWKFTARVLTYQGWIYVPKDDLLRYKVKSLFHNNPGSGQT